MRNVECGMRNGEWAARPIPDLADELRQSDVSSQERLQTARLYRQSAIRNPHSAFPWVMAQTWHDLLFAHWPVDAEAMRAALPSPFVPDTFAGHAWLGVVPFWMSGVRARGLPEIPW